MSRATSEQVLAAQAHVVGLLNEIDSVLTGWVLEEDQEKVKKLTDPLYELCDKDK